MKLYFCSSTSRLVLQLGLKKIGGGLPPKLAAALLSNELEGNYSDDWFYFGDQLARILAQRVSVLSDLTKFDGAIAHQLSSDRLKTESTA
jgi:hypothetical protein